MKRRMNSGAAAFFLVGASVVGAVWEMYATWVMWRGGMIWPVDVHVWGPHHGFAVLMFLFGWEIVAGLAYAAAVIVLLVLLSPVVGVASMFGKKNRAEV